MGATYEHIKGRCQDYFRQTNSVYGVTLDIRILDRLTDQLLFHDSASGKRYYRRIYAGDIYRDELSANVGKR